MALVVESPVAIPIAPAIASAVAPRYQRRLADVAWSLLIEGLLSLY